MVVIVDKRLVCELSLVRPSAHYRQLSLHYFLTHCRPFEVVCEADVVTEASGALHALTQFHTEKGDGPDGLLVVLHLVVVVNRLLKFNQPLKQPKTLAMTSETRTSFETPVSKMLGSMYLLGLAPPS